MMLSYLSIVKLALQEDVELGVFAGTKAVACFCKLLT